MLRGRWALSVREALIERIEGPPGLAAFDFDNTLIYNDLGEACMYYVLFQGLAGGDREEFWEIFRSSPSVQDTDAQTAMDYWRRVRDSDAEDTDALLGFAAKCLELYDRIYHAESMEAAYRWSRIFFSFLPGEELASIARYVFDSECMRELNRVRLNAQIQIPQGLRVVPELRELVAALRERDWLIAVVTASPQIIIAAAIDEWGLQPEDVIGMVLQSGADGELRPQIIEPYPIMAGKTQALNERFGRMPDLAIGDSRGDAEMLEAAGLAVLIDRGNESLRERLQAKGVLLQSPLIHAD